jgi:putative PIN family toxin of toxin-antitoxin system
MDNQVHRVVLDTNVVFEGLTKKKSACGIIIDAWLSGVIQVFASGALVYEYNDVLSRKISVVRWKRLQILFRVLLSRVEYIPIYYTWRPASPDPGDDLVIDCVMNANAILVTSNTKVFQQAKRELGLQIITPVEFVKTLAK